MADDFLQPQQQYGEQSVQAQLLKEAPISGAPTLPTPAAVSPLAGMAGSSGPAPRAQPTALPPMPQQETAGYYQNVADTWAKLARTKHASPVVKAFARMAKDYAKRVEAGEV